MRRKLTIMLAGAAILAAIPFGAGFADTAPVAPPVPVPGVVTPVPPTPAVLPANAVKVQVVQTAMADGIQKIELKLLGVTDLYGIQLDCKFSPAEYVVLNPVTKVMSAPGTVPIVFNESLFAGKATRIVNDNRAEGFSTAIHLFGKTPGISWSTPTTVITFYVKPNQPGATVPVLLMDSSQLANTGFNIGLKLADSKGGKMPAFMQMPVLGDLNADFLVNDSDVIDFADQYGKGTPGLAADFNQDGKVDLMDLIFIAKEFK